MKSKSLLLLNIIGIAILFLMQACGDSKSSFRKVLVQASEEVNKQCPITVDAETRLDNTTIVGDDIFQYNYTFILDEKETLDTVELKEFMIPIATKQLKSPSLESLRKHKTIFTYLYNDKNNAYALSFSITPEMYNK